MNESGYAIPLVLAERGYLSFDQQAGRYWNADFLCMFLKIVSEFIAVPGVCMLKQMPKLQILELECYNSLEILMGKTFWFSLKQLYMVLHCTYYFWKLRIASLLIMRNLDIVKLMTQ